VFRLVIGVRFSLQKHFVRIDYLLRVGGLAILGEGDVYMSQFFGQALLRFLCAILLCVLIGQPAIPAVRNMAVVVSVGSKLSDVPLAELTKYCKGSAKTWPDGKSFVIILKSLDSPDMHVALQKLFGGTAAEARAIIAKLNDGRQTVKIVESDDDLLRAVNATPGAIGLIDVYSINSSVKVLRIDGKLPFDMGYALRGL
jgi:hypothetical protein